MNELSDKEVISACRVLFGPDIHISRDFLWYLQPEGAKSAFRKKAKESHPDCYPMATPRLQHALGDEFSRISESYKLVCTFLNQRDQLKWKHSGTVRNHPWEEKGTTQRDGRGDEGGLFYKGAIPWMEIKTGKYLYFKGLVSFQVVLKALAWQRKQRPVIGVLARKWGWLDQATVDTILSAAHLPGPFGERALKLGALSPRQHKSLVYYQQACQQRLGSYFVQNGIVSEQQMEVLSRERLMHNLRVKNSRR